MSDNEELVSMLTMSLRQAFSEERDKLEEKYELLRKEQKDEHKGFMRSIYWFGGILVTVLGSIFVLIGRNNALCNTIIKEESAFHFDVGLLDHELNLQFPDNSSYGSIYEMYVKRRGGSEDKK